MTPEEQARVITDEQLTQAGWHVCDRQEIDLVSHQGSAVREVPMAPDHGRVDYLLFVDKQPVGVIEAKPVGTSLSEVQWQSTKYAKGLPAEMQRNAVLNDGRLPFVFEASGTETHFTNGFDPNPRARKVFNFQQPETLARIIREAEANPEAPTWRAKVQSMPPLDDFDLRPAQVDAINNIEASLAAQRHSRSLVQMATGAGKTRMAVAESYRLLKHGDFNRILFLVDRNNLGDQTLREFRDYTTPDDGRKFSELYNVDKLTSAGMVDSSKVVISTIQRVFAALRGEPVTEDDDPDIDEYTPDTPVTVEYQEEFPPESFDLVIIDECHRSIYGVWKAVLEYFDAHLLGLTATPTKQTFGFFQQNLVSEYTYPQSVADGVNVDFEVYRIKTRISRDGDIIEAGTVVPIQDTRTRQQRLEELDDDFEFSASQLDRAVTSRDQIRLVLETYRDKLFTEIFPGRSVVPKTLIFTKSDNHAEEVVQAAQRVFGKGNDFAAKITYTAKNSKELLQAFRNSPDLRIVVTVDMIATGTDVKPIECVFFMRDVKSRTYFEQMKGRGARTINDADFQGVTQDAKHKERFVIVDAVGVTEHELVDAAPLERKKSLSLKQLFERAANFTADVDEISTLASRLSRLERKLTKEEHREIGELAGQPLNEITKELMTVTDPDVIANLAQNAPANPDGMPDVEGAVREHINAVVEPLAGNASLRMRLLEIAESHERVIDEVSVDELLSAGGVIDFDKCRNVITSWKDFLEEHKDEITLIQIVYNQDSSAQITFKELRELTDRIGVRSWSIELLWDAFKALDSESVKKTDQHSATDLIALIRYTLEYDTTLVPFAETVEERYTAWLAKHAEDGIVFTERERWWLDHIKDSIIQSNHLTVEDLEHAPFIERGGVDGASRDLGTEAQALIDDLNMALAA